MSNINYSAIQIVIRKIKEIENEYRVCGDMNLSDELDKITDILDLLKNRWDLKIEALSKLQRKYILDSRELEKKEEKQCWQQVCMLIESLAKFNSYVDYISAINIVLEQVVEELQNLENQQFKSN